MSSSTAAFSLKPASPSSLGRVVLCHGFSGSPWELFPLGRSLADRGYSVDAPLLPGHGKTPEHLLFENWFTWLRAAEIELFRHQGPVFLGGLSMGALLSMILAARHPTKVKALVLLAPVVDLKGAGGFLRRLRHLNLGGLTPEWVDKKHPDIEDLEVRNSAPTLSRYPLARVFDLMTLQDIARESVQEIECPTLIVAAKKDNVVPYKSIEGLGREMPQSKMVLLQRGFHIIPRDCDRARAITEVATFLSQYS